MQDYLARITGKLLHSASIIKILLALIVVLLAPVALRLVDLPHTPESQVINDIIPATHQTLGVKDLIRAVKKELAEADQERDESNEEALFKVEQFELEINFMIGRHSTAGAELNVPEFIVIDKESKVAAERVQKIKLMMKVIPPRLEQDEVSGFTESAQPQEVIELNPRPPAKKGD